MMTAQGRDARDMTREMGKVLAETRGDVQEGIDRRTTWQPRGGGCSAD